MSADHARRVLRRLLKTMQVAHEREQAPSIFEIKYLYHFHAVVIGAQRGNNPLRCATPSKGAGRLYADHVHGGAARWRCEGVCGRVAHDVTRGTVRFATRQQMGAPGPKERYVIRQASKDFATKLGLPAKFTEGWGLWQSGLDGTLICRHRTAHRLLIC